MFGKQHVLLSAKLAARYLRHLGGKKKYEQRLQAKMQNHNRESGRTRVNGSGSYQISQPPRRYFAHQAKFILYQRALGSRSTYYQQTSRYLLPGIELQQKVFLRHSLAKEVDSRETRNLRESADCAQFLFTRERKRRHASLRVHRAVCRRVETRELLAKNVNNYIKQNYFLGRAFRNFYFLRYNK